jgi:phage tail-like protein
MARNARLRIWIIAAAALVSALMAALAVTGGVGFGTAQAQSTTESIFWRLETSEVNVILREVEGLGTAVKISESKVDGSRLTVKKPGLGSASNIVLRRGATGNLGLSDWHRQVIANGTSGTRHSGSIIAFDTEGRAVLRFDFTNGWPAQYRVEHESGLLVEEVTLAVDDIRRVQ